MLASFFAISSQLVTLLQNYKYRANSGVTDNISGLDGPSMNPIIHIYKKQYVIALLLCLMS